ncbi:MAG: STAS domain-containing protein [Bdellovibrionaceae bacterium]|nr:STAS domain-containing protein [Pseudobdellovibrionaceae bacterium]
MRMDMSEVSRLAAEPWQIFVAKVRIDAFNHEALVRQLRAAQSEGKMRIGLDLRATRFISLHAIQFITQFAEQFTAQGGRLALIAPGDKTQRHFEIYGSLDKILVFGAHQHLEISGTADLAAQVTPEVGSIESPIVTDVLSATGTGGNGSDRNP